MTTRLPPQCLTCVRWTTQDSGGAALPTCVAYPDGIPDDIWWNRADHRQPHEGDHGVQWEPLDGATFPEWAMKGD